MAVMRCEKGHFYDNEKFTVCPHCENDLPDRPLRGLNEGQTIFSPSHPEIAFQAVRQPVQVDLGALPPGGSDEKTVGIFRTEIGCDPVVGWLVCVDGKEKGRDYRLHAGRNFVGRALKNDIVLADDQSISREDHCSLVFEPRQNVFLLARGNGDGVVVNGEDLKENRVLLGDEVIEIGTSTLVFIPFCREGRIW